MMSEFVTAYHGTSNLSEVLNLGVLPYLKGIWLTTDLQEAKEYARRLGHGYGGVVRARIPKSWIDESVVGGPHVLKRDLGNGSYSIGSFGAEPNWYNMPEYKSEAWGNEFPDQPVEGQSWYHTYHSIPPSMLEVIR